MIGRDFGVECSSIPGAPQNGANATRNFDGEVFAIGHDHDLRRRIATENERRQANRAGERLEVARREIHDQALGLATGNSC